MGVIFPVLIALCQTNTITGNISANVKLVETQLRQAADLGADLAVFPEMTLTGYPPRDLLEYESFLREVDDASEQLDRLTVELKLPALIGQPLRNPFPGKKAIVNGAVLYGSGQAERPWMAKKLLPTYDVFDEHRYFEEAPADHTGGLMHLKLRSGRIVKLGVTVCEDIWKDNEFWKEDRLYPVDPVESLAKAGAEILINLSASPYVSGKPSRRLEMLRHTARRWNLPVVLVNQVGGNDQVVFDGGSVALNSEGQTIATCGWFTETMVMTDWQGTPVSVQPPSDIEAMEAALRLGLRDYLRKTGFVRVIVGNSGGIDSAVVLSLCAAELGPEQVVSVSLPGPFTTNETRLDSMELAKRWGIRHLEFPIVSAFEILSGGFDSEGQSGIAEFFQELKSAPAKVANENLQSRLRGVVLMWLSNALSDRLTLLVTTGNKSELATGYCTLYGDMCGGLALISDVPKMGVYALAKFLNAQHGNRIPESIIAREPSAELAPNQRDSDSLPPYPVLDEIVRLHVEEKLDALAIADSGVCDLALAIRVLRLIERNEYKRQQAAPGIKVTSKAFGVGRRMPIARGR